MLGALLCAGSTPLCWEYLVFPVASQDFPSSLPQTLLLSETQCTFLFIINLDIILYTHICGLFGWSHMVINPSYNQQGFKKEWSQMGDRMPYRSNLEEERCMWAHSLWGFSSCWVSLGTRKSGGRVVQHYSCLKEEAGVERMYTKLWPGYSLQKHLLSHLLLLTRPYLLPSPEPHPTAPLTGTKHLTQELGGDTYYWKEITRYPEDL